MNLYRALFDPIDTVISLLVVAAFLSGSLLLAENNIVRISDAEAKKATVTRVDPQYPPMAKQLRLSGTVMVDVTIDPQGNVEKAEIVSGNPVLGNAAVAAVSRWKFKPFTSGGSPAKAVGSLSFDFKL